MQRKIVILLITFISVLICLTPIMATEVTYSFLDTMFVDNHFEIDKMIIEKEFIQHTNANGKVKKDLNYYIEFNIKSDSDSIGENTANITSYNKNNKTIESFEYDINTVTDYKLKFNKTKKIDHVTVVITDGNGNVIVNNTTSHIKKTKNITKDKPVEKKKPAVKKTTSSGAVYWASEKSNKFHVPSCEWAQKIASYNKIVFHSKEEARNAGYQACEVCNP